MGKGIVWGFILTALLVGSATFAVTAHAAGPSFTRTLSIGSSGSDVTQLQSFLKTEGFYTYATLTGYFGSITEIAVKAYQTAEGIEPVGIVGPQTRAEIANSGVAGTPQITSTAGLPSSSLSSLAPLITENLDLGSTGIQVTELQTWLIAQGYSIPAGVTGYYGAQTEAAVREYQLAQGISPVGTVGPLTRASVNETIAATAPPTVTTTTTTSDTTSASTPPVAIVAHGGGGGGGGGSYYTSTPVISAISAGSIGNTSATITWTTDQAATSEVYYGTTSSYGNSSSLDSTLVTSHSVLLSGLIPGTVYHFEVVSANSSGQSITSSDQIFTTTTTADTVPPSVTLTAPAGGTTITGTGVSLSASASDNVAVAQVTFLLDGTTNIGIATTSPYTALWNSKLAADGVHTIEAVAEDTSGNYATTTPVSITIDNTAPVRSAGAPSGTLAVNTTSTTLSLTTNENATCKYSTTAGSAYSGMTSFTITGGTSHSTPIFGLTNNGSYIYYVKCSDTVGNTNGADYAISFTVSAGSGPTVIVTVPTNNTKLGGSAVSLTATATDTVPVSTVQFFLVGTTTSAISSSLSSAPYTTTWNSTSVPDGTYSIVAVAHDSASLSATSSAIAITVDNTAPVLSAGSPTGTLAFGTTETTLSVVTNEHAICKYSTTPGTAYSAMTVFTNTGNTTHSSTISGLTNGSSYTYYVKCMDTVGNTDASDYPVSFSVAADTVPPSVAIISPNAGATLSGTNISLIASSTDNVAVAGVQFFLDGAHITSVVTSSTTMFSAIWNSTSASNGSHSLVAVAEDTSNNFATSSAVSVTVDNTAPIISSLATSTTSTSAIISWTTNKAATSVLNYGPTTSYGTSSSSPSLATSHLISLTGLTVSTTYHFQIVSTDQYGNTGTSTDQTFTTPAAPDTTAPVVLVTSPSSGATVSGSSVALTASSTDNVAVAGVTFYLDGTKYGSELTSSTTIFSTSWNSTATTSGTHQVFAVSRDTSNNYATSSPISFIVTNSGPTISAIASSTTQTSATITWTTGTNANSLINYGPTSSYGSASSTAALATSHTIILSGLTAGTTYHFQINSTDAFSNTSTSSDLTLTTASIPVTPPTVTVQAASNIGMTLATLNGTITSNNNASSTIEGFNYGLTTAYGSATSTTGTYGTGSFALTLSGLSPSTTYHYQAFAANTAGTGSSTDQTFTTAALNAPVISAIASSTTQTSATITWTTDQAASSTVLYGPTSAYGTSSTSPALVTSHSISLTGLTAATTYDFQVGGANSAGTVSTSSDQTFTTASIPVTPPTVTAQSASSIGTTTATLNGTIASNNNASSTVEGFYYGLTTAYGSTASTTGTFNTGAFTQSITGLTSGTTYHYQAFAANTAGTGSSTDQTFTTVSVTPPTITTQAATNIATSSVTFNGTIVADNNASTTVRGFVYGLTTNYTATTTHMSVFGLGAFATTSPTLTASTTYHYAAYGTNSAGTGYGADQVFTTAIASSTPGPIISNLSSGTTSPPSSSGATITWTTSGPANATVFYGPTTSYGSSSSTAAYVTSQSIMLSGLTASTTYHYYVQSADSLGNTSTSTDQTFTTMPVFSGQTLDFGDSRIANAGGLSTTHTAYSSYSSTVAPGFSWAGCIPFESNNSLYYNDDYNFGVAGQSTAGFVSRYNVASYAGSGGTASNYVGSGGSITSTDNEYNWKSNNLYSSLTYPTNFLFYMGGINDSVIGPASPVQKQSMINTVTLLNAWRAAGKVVFLSNEYPNGVATIYSELYTIPVGGGTYTTVNASTYYKNIDVTYTPAPGGTNDGVKLTQISSAPGAGQYSVSGGAYTFSSADAGATVNIEYTYLSTNRVGTQLTGKIALHNWLSSSAADFVDPASGVDYGMPGALYNRSWVVPVDTWDTIADPNATSTAYNLPNTLVDGIHPTIYGCQLVAKSFTNAAKPYIPSTDYSNLPTHDTELLTTANGTLSTYTSTTTSPASHPYWSLPITPGSFDVIASTSSSVLIGTDTNNGNGTGTISGTGFAAGSTINYSTGAYILKFTTTPANGVKIFGSNDPTDILGDGMFYPAEGFASATSTLGGCTGTCQTSGNITSANNTGLPLSTYFATSIDTSNALQLGSGALKLDFELATTSTMDSYPEMVIKLSGLIASSTKLQFSLTSKPVNSTAGGNSDLLLNTKYRATAVVKIDPGPNGRLYGLTGVQISANCVSPTGTSFTPVGETASYTGPYTGFSWAPATKADFVDSDVSAGELRIPILSQACDTTGMTGTPTGSASIQIVGDPNTPISATIHISRVSMRPYSY